MTMEAAGSHHNVYPDKGTMTAWKIEGRTATKMYEIKGQWNNSTGNRYTWSNGTFKVFEGGRELETYHG